LVLDNATLGRWHSDHQSKSKHPWNNFSARSSSRQKSTKSSPSSRDGAVLHVLCIRSARRRKTCITSIYFMTASRRYILPVHPARPTNAQPGCRSRPCVERTCSNREAALTPPIINFAQTEIKDATTRKLEDALCGTLHKSVYLISRLRSAQLHDHAVCPSRSNPPTTHPSAVNAMNAHPGRW
jgi:hypothetical protein